MWAKLRPAAPMRAAKSANCSNCGTVSRRMPTFTLNGNLPAQQRENARTTRSKDPVPRQRSCASRVAPSRLNATCVTASPMLDHERPHALEMPAVRDEAARQGQLGHRRENLPELPVKRRLAAGEHDLLDAHRVARVPGDAGEEIDGKKVRRIVVERVFVTKAVAAVQIADVGQLDRQPAWPVVRRRCVLWRDVHATTRTCSPRSAFADVSGSSRSVPASSE